VSDHSYQDLEVDQPDLTVALDKKSGGVPRIVFQGESSEDQEPPAQETSISGVVDEIGNGNGPYSEDSRHPLSGPTFTWIPESHTSGEDVGDAVEGEGELAGASRGTC